MADGVSAKMFRHYEEQGFVPKAGRTVAGYRCAPRERRARLALHPARADIGFSLKEIKDLVGLWNNRRLPEGNTGGTDISMFRRLPIDPALAELLKQDH